MESMLEAFFIIRYNKVETYLAVFNQRFYFLSERPYSGQLFSDYAIITSLPGREAKCP
jgi:hypothetical protein